MSIYEVGRVAVKTRGREAGVHCVVIDIVDHNYILVDGITIKRRRCNVKHLMPVPKVLDIKKGAKTPAVKKAIEAQKMVEEFTNAMKLDL